MNIAPIKPPVEIAGASELAGVERTRSNAAQGASFGSALGDALDEAHAAENSATRAAEQFARGDAGIGIHEVMIASEKANLAVRYVTTLKNKALEAYRELINTQV